MKYLFYFILILAFTKDIHAKKISKRDWIANKNIEELKTYVAGITDSQKILLYQVSYKMTDMFDSIKSLQLEELEKKAANKSVFVYRKEAYKEILSIKQFDDFLMMEEEKLQQWRDKKNQEKKSANTN